MAKYIVDVPEDGELLFSMLLEQMKFSAYPIEDGKVEDLSPEVVEIKGIKDIETGNVHSKEEFYEMMDGWMARKVIFVPLYRFQYC